MSTSSGSSIRAQNFGIRTRAIAQGGANDAEASQFENEMVTTTPARINTDRTAYPRWNSQFETTAQHARVRALEEEIQEEAKIQKLEEQLW